MDSGSVSASGTRLEAGREYEGTVVRWLGDRGFGFVRAAGEDVFCGDRDLVNVPHLRKGDRVRFEARMVRQGRWKAGNVELLGGEGADVHRLSHFNAAARHHTAKGQA